MCHSDNHAYYSYFSKYLYIIDILVIIINTYVKLYNSLDQ
jgi:hypothetical protein